MLSRLKEVGLHLNRRKCLFLQPLVTYLGYRIDAEGLHPTECKIQAINNAPRPQNLTELKSYLGLLTFYGKLIPNMSTLLAPLYQLLKSSTGWQWTEKQEETFQKLKKVLTSSSVLIHFDTNLDIILSEDASAYGVGAILAHKMPNGSERPVAFASRTLSCSEKNYSQIEKEALACVFGVKKFHQYLYGHHFTLITDHKPLIQLLNGQSAISTQASARIQSWTLTLSSYEYSIIFHSSEENANADAMSRSPVKECVPDAPNPAETVLLLEHLESSPVNISQIRNRTRRDPLLSWVYRFVMEGWTAQVDQDLLPFSKRKEELSTLDGCLLWGKRVIVPPSLRRSILCELHDDHPGTSRMKCLARMFVWWPGLDLDIERTVASCSLCQSHRAAVPTVPLQPWTWPTQPWTRIHMDLAGPFLNQMFLVLIDSYFKCIEVLPLTSTTSTALIQKIRPLFAHLVYPQLL